MTLEELRKRLSEVDRELIGLVAARQKIVAEIGAHKIQNSVPTRDYEREREVLKGAHEQARALGLEPGLAEEIMGLLIRSSLMHQEQTRVAAQTSGAGQARADHRRRGEDGLVVRAVPELAGIRGRGRRSERRAVAVPAQRGLARQRARSGFDRRRDADEGCGAACCSSLRSASRKGSSWTSARSRVRCATGLKRLVDAGCKVTSIHPMFGPDTRLLSGRHVVFCEVGVPQATREARALFASTMAEQLEMSLDDHDRLMAYVLGLSHALNLAFFTALAESGELVPRLQKMSSTTFDAQLKVASLVATDNPHLYFEIQALNDYGAASLHALRSAAERIQRLVESGNESGFVELMAAGRRYLETRT